MGPISRRPFLMGGFVLALTASAHAQSQGEGAVPRGGPGAVARPAEEAPAEPGKPVIVKPELVTFVEAPYPAEAQAADVSGSVVLKLTIDVQGNVTAAEVVQPGGHGFDEAAREAALKFKWKPATRDGVPIPVQIQYRYDFALKQKAPEAAAEAPVVGDLAGLIRVEGGETPLIGAEVIITLPDGSTRKLVTDEQGRWQIRGLPPGMYRISVRAEGFDPIDDKEEVVAGEVTELKLTAVTHIEGVIEVEVRGERPPREVTRRTVERREIERIPGTSGDALRSIQSLPGVARAPGLAGLLIVRGSAPDGTGYYVDGGDVPLIYHFGGLSSVIPTELLDRIDFYPGNFSAKYGRVMGGIVDVALLSPDTKCYDDDGKLLENKIGCYHGLIQADLIDARLMLQGPIGSSKEWSFAIGGRRSWLDTWLKPVLEEAGASVTSAPVYYDYQAIAEHRKGDSRTSVRLFGSDDRFEIIINDPVAEDPAFGGNLELGTSFMRVQAVHETELNDDVTLNAMLATGFDAVDFSLGNFLFKLKGYPIIMRSEFGFDLAKGVKLNTGLDFLVAPYDIRVRFPDPPRPGEPDPGPFATRPPRETAETGTVFRPAWYAELELQPSERLRLIPGARVDYARDSGHTDFSPRFNGRYDIV
ncbi:MAG TPA: TonB family protein, partial [Polyangiaceae bacterium]|nr:TonB family protein [Polyangiaceae bacterium]